MTTVDVEPVALDPAGPNAIGRLLGLMGDEWTILLIRESLLGARRYGDFTAALAISHAVLAGRLLSLQEAGLLRREVYQRNPIRAEYAPTEKIRTFWPILASIWDWERDWVDGAADTLPQMRHAVCGAFFSPELSCASCQQVATPQQVSVAWGPSGSWARSIPDGVTRRRGPSDEQRRQLGLHRETMQLFGNRWSSALISAAFRGLRRFSDFALALGISPAVLTERLRVFCAIGIFEARSPGDGSRRIEYLLTDKGKAFFPVVATSIRWSQQWFTAPEGPAVLMRHTVCGEPFVADLRCDRCRGRLRGSEFTAVPGERRTRAGPTASVESPVLSFLLKGPHATRTDPR